MTHSIVFREALVLDGTGASPFVADVAVDGDVVTEIGTVTTKGEEEIDCRGLALSPGFIDVHTHDDLVIHKDRAMAFKTLQGVTTVVTGNCGTSAVPFPSWLENIRQNPAAVNVAALIGHGSVRESVIGRHVDRAATPAESARMVAMVEEAMGCGAIGLSTGLVYAPGRYSPTEEIVQLASVVGSAQGIYTSHMRNERDGLLESVEETLHIGRATGVRVQVSHLKAIGSENFGLAARAVELIERARADGIEVAADQYPYTRGSTVLEQLVTAGAFDGPSPFGFVDAGDVLIASAPRHPEWEGRVLADIAVSLGLDGAAAARHLLDVEGLACMIVYANQSEDNVEMIMRRDFVMIGSDGLPAGSNPHPRLHHTFPRVLGEYSRERGVLGLPEAIHRMTGLPASWFRLHNRGQIRTGAFADITVFNPSTVADTGTYGNPTTPPDGFTGTWVNGCRVSLDTTPTDGRPGRVLTLT